MTQGRRREEFYNDARCARRCGNKIGTVTQSQGTWSTFAQVEPATSSTCVLQFVSTTGGAGGVVPTNVQVSCFFHEGFLSKAGRSIHFKYLRGIRPQLWQVIALGSGTTNTYPEVRQ